MSIKSVRFLGYSISFPEGALPILSISALYWSLVFLLFDKQYYDITHSNPIFNWSSSEWLIGYQSGFVRRGLFGSILRAAYDNGLPRDLVTTLFPSIGFFFLSLVWFALGVKEFLRSRTATIWLYCWLINPAGLLFFLMSGNIFRKDIVFLALLLAGFYCLVQLLSKALWPIRSLLLYGAFLSVNILLIGLHEGLYLFVAVPLFAGLSFESFSIALRRRSKRIVFFLLPLFVALFGSFLSFLFNGNPEQVIALCQSWSTAWPAECTIAKINDYGALSPLGWSAREALAVSGLRNLLSLLAPLNVAALIVYPALTGVVIYSLAGQPIARTYERLLAFLSVPFFVLLLVGCDWGRFLSIFVVMASVIALSAPDCVSAMLPSSPISWPLYSSVNRLFLGNCEESSAPSMASSSTSQVFIAAIFTVCGLPLIGYSSLDQLFALGVWHHASDRIVWILQVFFSQSIAR